MLFSYISFLIASPNFRIQTHSGMAGAEQLQVRSWGLWSSCVADGFWMAEANWGMLGACWAFRRWRFGSWRHWLTAVATKPVVVLWEMAGIPCTLQAPNLRDRSGIQEHTADLNRGTCRSVAGGRTYLAAGDRVQRHAMIILLLIIHHQWSVSNHLTQPDYLLTHRIKNN